MTARAFWIIAAACLGAAAAVIAACLMVLAGFTVTA